MHGSSACEQGLPAVDTSNISPEVSPILHVLSASEAEKLLEMLNSEQKIAAKAITIALDRYPHHSTPVKNSANVFFIDGPGGTGKTYFYNYIYSWKCGADECYRQMWQVSCRRQGMLTQGPAPDPKSKV